MFPILVWVTAIVVGMVMALNASFMLASPRGWFKLPPWLRAQGVLTEAKYASGWGALQVRLCGAFMLATILWVIWAMFFESR